MSLEQTSGAGAAAFEEAFQERMAEIAEACVACGKCFEACPITSPAGLAEADGAAVTQGVRDLLSGGEGSEAAKSWAGACVLSGECIKVCDYGVNPRLMLSMARMSMAQAAKPGRERRGQGVRAFAGLGRDVKVLSRLQLDAGQLARLGQGRDAQASPSDGANPPDVVFYTGCNVLKTPHIALLCLDILDVLGVSYRVLGGPSHCCGIVQYRLGDLDAASRLGGSAIDKFARTGASEVLAWCPSCFVQFSEINTPNYERAREEEPLPMRPFLLFLLSRIEDLRPHLAERVRMRVALHAHPGVDGVPDAARALLQAVPGVELVDLQQPEIGLMSNSMRALPDYQRQLQQAELEAAAAAGIDALVAVYHADHRELCAHERDWPFAIVNVLEIIAASMGILRDDDYKRLKLKQDASAILEDCAHMLSQHGIDRETARQVIETAMLADQPLPLRSGD